MTFDDHLPGYRGTLSRNVVTIAEVLKEAGYRTSMVGKWHVAETPLRKDQRDWLNHQVFYDTYSDLCNYPVNRGFDSHYGIIMESWTISIRSVWLKVRCRSRMYRIQRHIQMRMGGNTQCAL